MSFCKNCGQSLAAEAIICPGCGVPSKKGNAHCWNCGNEVSPLAEMCVKCGVRLSTTKGKSKTTAVVLSIFFSFWSWLYTYKRNAWKFWLGIFLVVPAVVGYISLFIYELNSWSWGADYWFAPAFYLCLAIPVVVWLWAIIDNAVRGSEFYKQYLFANR